MIKYIGRLGPLLALRLCELRRERGWSRRQAAQRAGINPTCLRGWEEQTSSPTLEKLELVAHAFETSVSDLLLEERGNQPGLAKAKAVLEDLEPLVRTVRRAVALAAANERTSKSG